MNEFIELLAEAIEKDDGISAEDRFRDYDEWDSLSALAVLAMINEVYDITIPRKDFDQIRTLAELFEVINGSKE